MTNIASSMSLEQSTTVFVFILSVLILKEKVSALKVIAIALCITGVIYIAIGDQIASNEHFQISEYRKFTFFIEFLFY